MGGTFDRVAVEGAVADVVKASTGVSDVRMMPPSGNVGAVAFARLPAAVVANVDWVAFGKDIAARTGLSPICVEDQDWSGTRVTVVVLDVPGVDEDWRYDYANKLPFRPRHAA